MDFSHGKQFEKTISSSLHVPVCSSPSSGSPGFFLVISVGRCKFRLSVDSVSSILCSILGGVEKAFNVLQLGDRVFRFSVSGRAVWGFMCLTFVSLRLILSKSSSTSGMMEVRSGDMNSVSGKMLFGLMVCCQKVCSESSTFLCLCAYWSQSDLSWFSSAFAESSRSSSSRSW